MTSQAISLARPGVKPVARASGLLVASLLGAGIVHLAVGPEHISESSLIGGAMLVGGLAQVALAFGVRNGVGSLPLAVIVITLNAGFVGGWLAALTVGLPVDSHPHVAMVGQMAAHGGAGHVEPVTPLGAVTAIMELTVLALVLRMRHGWWPPHREDSAPSM